MLAQLTEDYFSDPNWIYERKLDGERCLAFRNKDGGQLLSRNQQDPKEQLASPEQGQAPFADQGLPANDVHWVQPRLIAQIRFEEWTDSGKLRQPRCQ